MVKIQEQREAVFEEKLNKENIQEGDTLIMSIGGSEMEFKVGKKGITAFDTDFGPVPYSNLYLCRKK